ncbi:MAG: hypothetical protein CMN78_01560 [Spirochaetales bacterium]|nr:hypothetical protein [Spirochaetales bacterium]
MKRFDYIRPSDLREAIALLKEHNGRSAILAGGTDLLVQIKMRAAKPELLIDLKAIPNLNDINFEKGNGLAIGALTTLRELEASKVIRDNYTAISESALIIGSIQVRNKATVGGNLCNAAPSADMAPILIALGAEAVITGEGGERVILLEDFFLGPGRTALKTGEILTGLIVPPKSPLTGASYLRHTPRKRMDLAFVGVGSVVTTEADNETVKDARIALGAVAPTPMRAKKAEEVLRGGKISESLVQEAAQTASNEASPIDDLRASAEHRKEMVKVYTERSLRAALDRAVSAPAREINR